MATLMAAITIGGKGSSLSSISIYSVANKLAQVRIDSSILDKLSSSSTSSNKNPSPSISYQISFPQFLTLEEVRASSILLLSKLLLSSSPIRADIPILICQTLNSNLESESNSLSFDPIDVTEEEKCVLDTCLSVSVLDGICGLLDHGASSLSLVSETVAALSCEALKAKVSAFNLVDSGDGKCLKDEAGVASDLKVLLNGSKLVNGKVEVDAISSIPEIYGSLREAVRVVHSRVRVQLNSAAKSGISGVGKAWEGALVALAAPLRSLGDSSLSRMGLIVSGVDSDGLGSSLKCLIDEKCPSEQSLTDAFKRSSEAQLEKNYVQFVHNVNELFCLVMTVVSWEMITALVALEGSELLSKQVVPTNTGDAKVDKRSEKKKKVLGKGTTAVLQLIKERLQGVLVDGDDESANLQKLAENLCAFLDPKVPAFSDFLEKIKEIVESNESRRLPKLAKVIVSFFLEALICLIFLCDIFPPLCINSFLI